MNLIIVKNKYLNAFFLFMLVSALAHFLVIICIAAVTADFSPLNYFSILQIDYFLPGLTGTSTINAVSLVIAALLYLLIVKFEPRNPHS